MTYLEEHQPVLVCELLILTKEIARLAEVSRMYITVHADEAPAYYTFKQWANNFGVDPAELETCVKMMQEQDARDELSS